MGIAGFGPNNEIILDGKFIFKLMDTYGLPLMIINEALREKKAGFDVVQFIEVAIASKNFTYKTIKAKLLEDMPTEIRDDFLADLSKVAKMKGWE